MVGTSLRHQVCVGGGTRDGIILAGEVQGREALESCLRHCILLGVLECHCSALPESTPPPWALETSLVRSPEALTRRTRTTALFTTNTRKKKRGRRSNLLFVLFARFVVHLDRSIDLHPPVSTAERPSISRGASLAPSAWRLLFGLSAR